MRDLIDADKLAAQLAEREQRKRAIILEALADGAKWLVQLRAALGADADPIFQGRNMTCPLVNGWLIDSAVLALEREGLVEVHWILDFPSVELVGGTP